MVFSGKSQPSMEVFSQVRCWKIAVGSSSGIPVDDFEDFSQRFEGFALEISAVFYMGK